LLLLVACCAGPARGADGDRHFLENHRRVHMGRPVQYRCHLPSLPSLLNPSQQTKSRYVTTSLHLSRHAPHAPRSRPPVLPAPRLGQFPSAAGAFRFPAAGAHCEAAGRGTSRRRGLLLSRLCARSCKARRSCDTWSCARSRREPPDCQATTPGAASCCIAPFPRLAGSQCLASRGSDTSLGAVARWRRWTEAAGVQQGGLEALPWRRWSWRWWRRWSRHTRQEARL